MTMHSEKASVTFYGDRYTKCKIFKATKCTKPGCGNEILADDVGWMNYSSKRSLCLRCGEELSKNPQTATSPQQTTQPQIKEGEVCPFCDLIKEDIKDVKVIDRKSLEWKDFRMCGGCQALMTAQFRLKCAGLWRPVLKQEAAQ